MPVLNMIRAPKRQNSYNNKWNDTKTKNPSCARLSKFSGSIASSTYLK